MVRDDVIRDLLRQSNQGLEPEPTMVLADALLETDRPELGEDLALLLANRRPFPRAERGRPIVNWERAVKVVFRRIHRRFAWSPHDEQERRRGLRELKEIATNWYAGGLLRGGQTSSEERDDEIATAIEWLEGDGMLAHPSDRILYERATWLLDGTFGRGAADTRGGDRRHPADTA